MATGGTNATLNDNIQAAIQGLDTAEKKAKNVNAIVGNVSTRLPYSSAPTPPQLGGGGPSIPQQPTSAAGDNGGLRRVWDKAKDYGSVAMSFMPNAAAGVERQQRTFWSGIAAGSYEEAEKGRGVGFERLKGDITSINADVRVGQMAYNFGYTTKNQGFGGLFDITGAASRLAGYGNEEFAQQHLQTVGNVDFQNAGLIMGIQTKDQSGMALTGEALYENIYNKLIKGRYKGERGAQALKRALTPGGALDQNPMLKGMSQADRDLFQKYIINKTADEGFTLEGGTEESNDE
jgi:hypothetical protein